MSNLYSGFSGGLDKADGFFKRNAVYILAFFLPVISMLICFIFKDVFPFGDEMYLRSDNYHQYTPYLQILQDKFSNGGSLLYTWEIGGGMNFIAIAAYYLSSPFNLILLFFRGHVSDFVDFFIVFKMGLASATTTYYLTKKFNRKDMITAAFGAAYALSAYFAAFSWNIMWLDCMFLLPIIILGIDKIVKEGKCLTYIIALGLGIFSNYYIGIMLCIYSVLYFIFDLFTEDIPEEKSPVAHYLQTALKYGASSLLAGGLAACVILPEYFNLLTTRSADTEFPTTIERYFSIFYMLFRSLMYIPVADLKYPHDPNIYCSVAVFLLIPLYFMCRKIKPSKRIGSAILVVIMLLSFSINIPNYIWHGFHFPNSLACRESFIYIFLIITLAYEAAIHIKEFSTRQIVGTFAGAVGLILMFEEMFDDTSFFSDLDSNLTDVISLFRIIYYSLFALTVYVVLIILYRIHEDLKGFMVYLLVLAIFCELTVNMCATSIPSTSNRTDYYGSTDAFHQLEDITDADAKAENCLFYRSELVDNSTRNDGGRYDYNSISTFSSVSAANIQYYLEDIGMQTSFNAYEYDGHTPLTSALFSIKYEYTKGTPSSPTTSTYLSSAQYTGNNNTSGTLNVYKNNYTLPLGFMIDSGAMSNWNLESGNPFDIQNNFVKNAIPSFDKSIFHRLVTDGAGTISTQYSLDANDNYDMASDDTSFDVYFYLATSAENLTATVTNNDGTTSTYNFSATQQNYICHVGEVQAGSTIAVTSTDGSSTAGLFAYAFDLNTFTEAFNELNSQGLTVTEQTDTYISGQITAKTGGLMYTSVLYDEGWTAYIDGVEASTTPICGDALLGINLAAGTHTIELKYMPKGLIVGCIITGFSLVILLAVIFEDKWMIYINPEYVKKKAEKKNEDNKENKESDKDSKQNSDEKNNSTTKASSKKKKDDDK